MKYRDPKTGEVFEDIGTASSYYCVGNGIMCRFPHDCPIGNTAHGDSASSCFSWCYDHPTEAARLMGLEVITDKEEPMEKKGKPRICEVLGVEVGTRFRISGVIGTWFIQSDGQIETDCGAYLQSGLVCDLINRPDRIIRLPRFTQEEVTVLRYFSKHLHIAHLARRKDGAVFGGECEFRSAGDGFTTIGPIVGFPRALFPSLRAGQSVRLEDVLKGGESHG